jgi:hypothetical protein
MDGRGQGEEGLSLLRESYEKSRELGILCVLRAKAFRWAADILPLVHRKSCTVVINRKKVCVHDGKWEECEVGVCTMATFVLHLLCRRVGTESEISSDRSTRSTTDSTMASRIRATKGSKFLGVGSKVQAL